MAEAARSAGSWADAAGTVMIVDASAVHRMRPSGREEVRMMSFKVKGSHSAC